MPTSATPSGSAPKARYPIARLDLEEETRALRASPSPSGHLAKTLVHAPDMRLVLMTLDRGHSISPHHASSSLTIQTLAGRVIVSLLESSFDLGPGQVLAIERGVSHGLIAIDDSAILLTIAASS